MLKNQPLGFLSNERMPAKGKRKTKSLPFCSVSEKSIAGRLLPSRACVLFLSTSANIMNIKSID